MVTSMFYEYEINPSSACLTWMVPMHVEVSASEGDWVAVRDHWYTEQRPLMFSKKEWLAFVGDSIEELES